MKYLFAMPGTLMKHHVVTLLLIAAAIPLYVVGFASGGSVVLAAAVALEVWFWIRVVRGKTSPEVRE